MLYIDISELRIQLINSIEELIFKLNQFFPIKFNDMLKRVNSLFQSLQRKLLMDPKNLEDYLFLKNYLESESLLDDKKELENEIKRLKKLKEIEQEFLVEIHYELEHEILIAEDKSEVVWAIKNEVQGKLESLKPKFRKILDENSQK
jgi:hypothetical protein